MARYKLILSYDGTRYKGWQIQPNASTIQGLVEEKLQVLLKKPIRLIGAGRTDAGVHALQQTAHFDTDDMFDIPSILKSLNGMLPKDIRILQIGPAEAAFHAQLSAIGKIYHYHIWQDPVLDPFLSNYRHHHRHPLCLSNLQEAAGFFLGTHDFRSFTNAGSHVPNTVRTLYRLDIQRQPGGLRLEYEGNGFLYKMVRNITGTLLEIASGNRPVSSIKALLNQSDRTLAGPAAPPHALFLVKAIYP